MVVNDLFRIKRQCLPPEIVIQSQLLERVRNHVFINGQQTDVVIMGAVDDGWT